MRASGPSGPQVLFGPTRMLSVNRIKWSRSAVHTCKKYSARRGQKYFNIALVLQDE